MLDRQLKLNFGELVSFFWLSVPAGELLFESRDMLQEQIINLRLRQLRTTNFDVHLGWLTPKCARKTMT